MGAMKVGSIICHIVATIFLLGAIAATVAALITPAWQVIFIAEFKSYHQHGLWMDCTKGERHLHGNDPKEWSCQYKFGKSEEQNQRGELQHRFTSWHAITLGLLCGAVVLGLVALLFSFCAQCVRGCAIAWAVFSFLATGISAAALIVFFTRANEFDYRFIQGVTSAYEQENGYSFWCGVGGCLAFLMATIFSVLTAVLVVLSTRQEVRSPKTWPKHNTAV